MKTLFWIIGILAFTSFKSFGQDNSPVTTIADRYFKSYSGESEYRSNSMTEEMIKNIRKKGVWGNPNFDQFMSQIKLYRHVSFKTSGEQFGPVSSKIIDDLKRDRSYKHYFTSEQDGTTSYFYTLTVNKKVTELSFITFAKGRNYIGVGSFASDDIDIESIRRFVANK